MQPFSPSPAILTTYHMTEPLIHTDPSSVPNSPLELLFHSMAGLVHEKEAEKQQLHERCAYLEQQVQTLPQTCIVADGKQKKLIAIRNAIYEGGYIVGCNKKEFMLRMASALGCPGLADYNKALYNVKNTYQYDEIFTDLAQVAHNEITKND